MQEEQLTESQAKLRAFKKATPSALTQGNANLKFENMIKRAERKIFRYQRLATVQTLSSMAESLAMELLYTPGTTLSGEEIARIYQESGCEEVVPDCTDSAHRKPDGTCNNLAKPTWGAINTPLRRLIPARYDDGMSRGRGFLQSQGSKLFSQGVFNAPNPSPRITSTEIIKDKNDRDAGHTHILMQWGQFLDHDMSLVPEYEKCPEACEVTAANEGRCYPFPVPEEDEDVSVTLANSKRCHEFHRSVGACPPGGQTVPPREQLSGITHFIDGSNVYSSTADILNDELRDGSSDAGLLKVGPPAQGKKVLMEAHFF